MAKPNKPDIGAILRDGHEVEHAMARASLEARLEHKRLGIPLVIWKDGKVVHVPPEHIVIDPEHNGSSNGSGRPQSG